MTPETLWKRYAAIWSSDPARRESEMEACLADDVTYCDPNGLLAGRSALSGYMGEFQRRMPAAQFEILAVLDHHGRTLSDWRLRGADGGVMQTGTSFAALGEDGRLRAITGFFRPAASA